MVMRLSFIATAIVVLALVIPAPAQSASPTLTGETLSGSATSVSNSCTSRTSGGTVIATYSGTASGPFPGTFTETLTAQFPPDPVVSSVRKVSATFTITSGTTTVTGRKRFFGGSSFCTSGSFTVFTCEFIPIALGPDRRSCLYRATINTPTGTFRDEGKSGINANQLTLDEFFISD